MADRPLISEPESTQTRFQLLTLFAMKHGLTGWIVWVVACLHGMQTCVQACGSIPSLGFTFNTQCSFIVHVRRRALVRPVLIRVRYFALVCMHFTWGTPQGCPAGPCSVPIGSTSPA